ncbi:MAG: hypothetical protein ACT6WE_30110, partial [Shinella sp.]|uniref:hypothetical protein n=1 Tax=Shinella sp. TaxID=1870904 RepID=UPI0040352992
MPADWGKLIAAPIQDSEDSGMTLPLVRSIPEDDASATALADFNAHGLGFLPGRPSDAGRIAQPCSEGSVALLLDQRFFLV